MSGTVRGASKLGDLGVENSRASHCMLMESMDTFLGWMKEVKANNANGSERYPSKRKTKVEMKEFNGQHQA